MKLVAILSGVVVSSMLVACAGSDEPQEPTGQSEDHLSVSCIQAITAPPGSAQYWVDFQKCMNQPSDTPPSTGSSGGGAVNQSCQNAVNCINGICTCNGGAHNGENCGSLSNCQTYCKTCN
ncbi:hypothetical protein AKJ09_03557 [Labilithrix luteola]|uniref:Uncharacterized protein n=1 Tax=Labilithrix luteola TaxID=1391654 RepID=A0A0K1PTM4_9BACT|nr:hypothetical protein [Labilithrix luteola]AKU96893.1 hypothetical protein AKJ09_03557 [Labilithrix luteola]